MRALEELPEQDKDSLFPIFPLKPWMSSKHLDSTLARIEQAYGARRFFVDIAEPEPVEKRRPVHDEIDELLVPDHGYANWCEFVETRPNLIPAVQLGDPAQLAAQLERLHALGRGALVPVAEFAFPLLTQIVQAVAARTGGGERVCFLLDLGKGTKDLLLRQIECTEHVRAVLAGAPEAFVSLSASSFPTSFVNLDAQDIYERQLFDSIALHVGSPKLIYGDRGSARAESQQGGGGTPSPRIDYAQTGRWLFFRDETEIDPDADEEGRRAARVQGYIDQADALVTSDAWDPDLHVWGTQMIERTALGDEGAISAPVSSTAARINIHLHRQIYFDDPSAGYETDEDWID
jgi:hypothetical protein